MMPVPCSWVVDGHPLLHGLHQAVHLVLVVDHLAADLELELQLLRVVEGLHELLEEGVLQDSHRFGASDAHLVADDLLLHEVGG